MLFHGSKEGSYNSIAHTHTPKDVEMKKEEEGMSERGHFSEL